MAIRGISMPMDIVEAQNFHHHHNLLFLQTTKSSNQLIKMQPKDKTVHS